MDKPLYEQDFFRWTEEQARALRAAASQRLNAPLDWENLAEEIESLGRSDRRQLASRVQTVIEHLMKLQLSPAEAPRRGWEATIVRERQIIRALLDESPSLRGTVAELVAKAVPAARDVVETELAQHREAGRKLVSLTYTEEQVLGAWLPG